MGKGIDFRNVEAKAQPKIELAPGVFDELFDQESEFVVRAQANSILPNQKREERGMYDDYDDQGWDVGFEKIDDQNEKERLQSGKEWKNVYGSRG